MPAFAGSMPAFASPKGSIVPVKTEVMTIMNSERDIAHEFTRLPSVMKTRMKPPTAADEYKLADVLGCTYQIVCSYRQKPELPERPPPSSTPMYACCVRVFLTDGHVVFIVPVACITPSITTLRHCASLCILCSMQMQLSRNDILRLRQ